MGVASRRLAAAAIVLAASSCTRPTTDCVPATCQSLGLTSGTAPDGCGETLDCTRAPRIAAPPGYPVLDGGLIPVLSTTAGSLVVDPKLNDAITLYGDCLEKVLSCMESQELDTCVRTTRPCLSDRPWEEAEVCCPSACADAYAARRAAGADDEQAFRAVFIDDTSCFPGVAELVGGGR